MKKLDRPAEKCMMPLDRIGPDRVGDARPFFRAAKAKHSPAHGSGGAFCSPSAVRFLFARPQAARTELLP